MKDKILFLIIGILVGAIITTAGFFIYMDKSSSNTEKSEGWEMDGNGPMGGNSFEFSNGTMENPPTKPDGDNGMEPPSKPNDNNGANSPVQSNENSSNNSIS